MKLHKLTAIVLALVLTTESASAGITGALDSMFMSNGTAPTAINTADRNGFMFGGAAIHVPVQNVNLISFDPPRFNAGCGGIDLYLGSFSFINSQALVALFKQIVANAAGALFYAAIQAISPNLADIMSKFQSVMKDLNNMFRTTCSMGAAGAADLSSISSTLTQHSAALINSATSFVSDFSSGETSSPSQTITNNTASNQPAGNSNPGLGTAPTNPEVGNFTWKLFASTQPETQLAQAVGAANSNNATTEREFLMSFSGTMINNPGNSPTDNGQTANASSTMTTTPGHYEPSIHFLDLIDGAGPSAPSSSQNIMVYGCTDDQNGLVMPDGVTGCSQLDINRQWDFEGTRSLVHKMLFGTPSGGYSLNAVQMQEPSGTAADSYTPYSNGIIYLITHCPATGGPSALSAATGNTCGMTSAQLAFLNALTVPLQSDVMHLQVVAGLNYGNSLSAVFRPIEEELAMEYAVHIAAAVSGAISKGISGSATFAAKEPDTVKDALKQLEKDIDDARTAITLQKGAVQLLQDSIMQLLKNNTNAIIEF